MQYSQNPRFGANQTESVPQNQAPAGRTGYGASAAGGQTAAGGFSAGSLTQAGVSNFSQQVNNAYQQLQKVQRELIQAQNQVEVQAQAQARQLKQLQQLIEAAGQDIQQIDAMSRAQRSGGGYPLS